jgi:rRNA maturation endonuclease Nob1
VPPRGTDLPAACASCPSNADILVVRHADDHITTRDTRNLRTGVFQLQNVFQNLNAEDAVERVIWKLKRRNIARNCFHSRMSDIGSGEV